MGREVASLALAAASYLDSQGKAELAGLGAALRS
jgi:hypothetical protein